MDVINAIYYTDKLYPIPVKIVKINNQRASIQTNSGRLLEVDSSRLITILEPITGTKTSQSIRTKPPGYITVQEYCIANNLEIDEAQYHRIKILCGWECRKTQTSSWLGKYHIRFYPETIIDTCYKKMISEQK